MITVSQLSIYPIKSTGAIHLDHSEVESIGLHLDRRWTLVDQNNQILTAREYPILMDVKTKINAGQLEIFFLDQFLFKTPLSATNAADVDFQIWKNPVTGATTSPVIDQWFSNLVNKPCRLIFKNINSQDRPMSPKNGGKTGDLLSYADSSPILLCSEASLQDLNTRLAQPIGMNRFRPNIVVQGALPFAEDTWTSFKIGEAEFEVGEGCKRCVLISIDPTTKQKDSNTEPLRTLASYRKHPRGGVSFGIHVIPRKLGKIHLGDTVVFG